MWEQNSVSFYKKNGDNLFFARILPYGVMMLSGTPIAPCDLNTSLRCQPFHHTAQSDQPTSIKTSSQKFRRFERFQSA